ncbi:MOSC domain-containing protein [Halorubrum xinjiangense]|uniref:MOSC domain-containing protein n=1 Tax=Halorubrum xinjiangense TaxID=261291 RepID=A0A1G7S665_9EURY|nr:MOSC domain-containing protein [Halorubrum xinjiangense]SDG18515.1 MOSC domain-containing protein [Halorubrum xinjiangense]
MPAGEPPGESADDAGSTTGSTTDSASDSATGAVNALVTAPESGAPPVRRDAVEIRPDGVEGDRYRSGDGHFQLDACAVTLVAAEALAAVREETGIDVTDGRHRRNVVVGGFGAELDALLDATVAVGDALLRPTRRRPPCAHVEELAGEDGLASALRNRGGLCCDVVEPGRVAVGDAVRIREADPRTAGAAIAERLADQE